MQRNPVVWFEIYVQDIDRAKKFYEEVLGVDLMKLEVPTPGMTMYSFPMAMDAAGASGAIVHMEGCPSGGLGTLVYFACEDCANEASRVEAAGGKLAKPKMSIGEYGFIALATDTEGNMIGLHSQR